MSVRLLPALLLALDPYPLAAQASDLWTRGGSDTTAYVVVAHGSVTDSAGATVSVRSTRPTTGTVIVESAIPADAFRLGRVRLTGELRTRGAGGVSLWMRVEGPSRAPLFDDGADQRLRGTNDWVRRQIALPVPRDAGRLIFGAVLTGTGAVEVRHLRLEPIAVADSQPAMSDSARMVLDSALATVKAHALWRDTVTWAVVEPELQALAVGAADPAEAFPAIQVLLTRLGDNASTLVLPRQASAREVAAAGSPPVIVHALRPGVGYVAMPGYRGHDTTAARAYVASVYASLERVRPEASCGWIIDLRANDGGNLSPMLAGLKPFLGDGVLGVFGKPDGKHEAWTAPSYQGAEPAPTLAALASAHVAVITGPRTTGSGEAVALSFRGRDRTRSFGAPTAGLSAGFATFPLPGGAGITLVTARDADRAGRQYGGPISPDTNVMSSARAAAAGDAAALAATRWLREQAACR